MKSALRKSALMAAAAMVAAAANGSELSKEDAKVIHDAKKDIEAQVPKMHDWGTPPDVFGRWYAGSSLKRKNDIRRKHNAKYHKSLTP